MAGEFFTGQDTAEEMGVSDYAFVGSIVLTIHLASAADYDNAVEPIIALVCGAINGEGSTPYLISGSPEKGVSQLGLELELVVALIVATEGKKLSREEVQAALCDRAREILPEAIRSALHQAVKLTFQEVDVYALIVGDCCLDCQNCPIDELCPLADEENRFLFF